MLKKLLYHGSFAVLGISLLVGMAILQANGLKTANALPDSADEQVDAAPPTDNPVAGASATANPSNEVQLSELPATPPAPAVAASVVPQKVLAHPPVQAAVIARTSAKKAPEVVKDVPLDNIQNVAVYDSHRKTATRKIYPLTPNGLRQASAYYQLLGQRYGNRATVQAKLADGTWAIISAQSFKQYVGKNLDL